MKFHSENEAEVHRLYRVEGWSQRAISRYFNCHHTSIWRVLHKNKIELSDKTIAAKKRSCMFQPYAAFSLETLEKYPNICTTALFRMVKKRGYPGTSLTHFRNSLKKVRPTVRKEAFLRLETLPGEEAQADWASFGHIQVGNTKHKLWAFVMVLSHSRMVFVKYYYNCKMPFFLDGFQSAFEFFGGVPKKVLIDNLKTGVSQRIANCIQYNSDFMNFCTYFLFEPRAVGVRKGNEKGKVERAIRYLRENFFGGKILTNIEELNSDVTNWCINVATTRRIEAADNRLVSELYNFEKANLTKLKDVRYNTFERGFLQVSKYCYVRFENNFYSVPEEFSQKEVEYEASEQTLLLYFKQNRIAEHKRFWERNKYVLHPEHHKNLLKNKKKANTHAGMARLKNASPHAETFLHALALRGESLGGAVNSLLDMLNTNGEIALCEALNEVVKSNTPRLSNLHFILKKNKLVSERKENGRLTTLPTKIANMHVKLQDLSIYDQISGTIRIKKEGNNGKES
jgi:transposase